MSPLAYLKLSLLFEHLFSTVSSETSFHGWGECTFVVLVSTDRKTFRIFESPSNYNNVATTYSTMDSIYSQKNRHSIGSWFGKLTHFCIAYIISEIENSNTGYNSISSVIQGSGYGHQYTSSQVFFVIAFNSSPSLAKVYRNLLSFLMNTGKLFHSKIILLNSQDSSWLPFHSWCLRDSNCIQVRKELLTISAINFAYISPNGFKPIAHIYSSNPT